MGTDCILNKMREMCYGEKERRGALTMEKVMHEESE